MRVKVRPMRRLGRQFLHNELNALPPHVGILRVGEVRDLSLERHVDSFPKLSHFETRSR